MTHKSNIPRYSYSDLAKIFSELERLEQECVSHFLEILKTKDQIIQKQTLAQIKPKVYPKEENKTRRPKDD